MTSEAVMRLLLAAADDLGRTFDHRDLSEWPPGSLQVFQKLGVVRRSAGGLTASCPSCDDGHIEVVTERPGADGKARLYIYCPEQLRLEVSAEMCRGWEASPDGLAACVATGLGLKGTPKPVVPNRLWRLGRIPCDGANREVVFASRLGETDATSVVAHVGVGGRAIVVVPRLVPGDRIWPGRVPAVVPLDRVGEFDGDQFAIDGVAFMEIVAEADAIAESKSLLPVDPQVKKQVVRRQLKAEIKGHLNDDVLIAARVTHGSTRKAATALTQQLGRPVSKEQVQRAIDRAGGLAAISELDDSNSVARTVASQSRDRAKKIEQYR
ncbi:MAG: hypothetical protein AAFY58_05830 [Planctomycetota bacterium]